LTEAESQGKAELDKAEDLAGVSVRAEFFIVWQFGLLLL
jgi:hypothetical protein